VSDEIVVETTYSEAAVRGIIDVNGDGRGQILVEIFQALSTEAWATFALVGGKLRQIESVTGIPLWVGVLGSAVSDGRFACVQDPSGERTLSTVRYVARDTEPYGEILEWSAMSYRISGAISVERPSFGMGTVSRAELEDPTSEFSRRWPSASTIGGVSHCGLRLGNRGRRPAGDLRALERHQTRTRGRSGLAQENCGGRPTSRGQTDPDRHESWAPYGS
jgi:hypothetical protein